MVELFEIAQGEVCRNRILCGRYRTLFATQDGESVVIRQSGSVIPQRKIDFRKEISGRRRGGFCFDRGRSLAKCFVIVPELQIRRSEHEHCLRISLPLNDLQEDLHRCLGISGTHQIFGFRKPSTA